MAEGAFLMLLWLVLRPSRSLAIAGVGVGDTERRQPRLAADGPALISWREAAGFVERAEMHFHLIAEAIEHRPAASRTEVAALVGARFAGDGHRIRREHRGGKESGTMMLAAIKTVAQADPVGIARGDHTNAAAKAAASYLSRYGNGPLEQLHRHRRGFAATDAEARYAALQALAL